jgi:hypothetical protein
MVEAGYMDPIVTPTPEPVVLTAEAYADNLVQIYVVYSQEVDEKTAEDLDNYEIDDVDITAAELQDDGVTVVLTLDLDNPQDQQDKVDLVINKVKDTAGTVIATDYTIEDIEFLDMTIPSIVEASVVGNDTVKVVFSEPMETASLENKANYEVKSNKTLYVKQATPQKNNTEVLVEMYAKLPEGEISFKVKSAVEDYAGFGVVSDALTLPVVKDEEKPVVIGYENADQDEVTLIWSEDIEIKNGAVDNFYHTNYNNKVDSTPVIDGNKMTLSFSDNPLPQGTAYVYVLKESVNDLWDNKNDQQMIQIEVEVDEIPPEVDEIKVNDEDEIVITFTENLDEETAEDEDNYTILDDEGEEIEDIISDISLNGKKVTIIFVEKLSGDYSIIIKDVEDKAGNEIVEVTVPFTVGDKTAPDPGLFEATIYKPGAKGQLLKVDFKDKMATEGKYSVLDVDKYVVDGVNLEDIDGVKIEITEDGKSVEISIPAEAEVDDGDDYLDVADGDKLVIARVADAAGNKMEDLYTDEITIYKSDEIEIDYARATARDTVKVRFKDNLDKFDIDDLTILDEDDDEVGIGSVEVGLDDGKTLVTFTLTDKLDYKYGSAGIKKLYVHVIGEESENAYGAKILLGDVEEVADKIAPTVAENAYDKPDIVFENGAVDSYITIRFTEDLATANDDLYAFDLIVRNEKGEQLDAGIAYTTQVIDGDKLEVTIAGKTNIANYSIQSVDSIRYIKDVPGNKAAKFSRVRN